MVDPAQNTKHLMAALENCPLIPVLTISRNDLIDPLGSILFNSRVQAIEVTLRSPCALEAINMMKKSYPHLLIGAGTILNIQQFELAQAAGADFLVTPGTPLALLEKLRDADLPIIPGAEGARPAGPASHQPWQNIDARTDQETRCKHQPCNGHLCTGKQVHPPERTNL